VIERGSCRSPGCPRRHLPCLYSVPPVPPADRLLACEPGGSTGSTGARAQFDATGRVASAAQAALAAQVVRPVQPVRAEHGRKRRERNHRRKRVEHNDRHDWLHVTGTVGSTSTGTSGSTDAGAPRPHRRRQRRARRERPAPPPPPRPRERAARAARACLRRSRRSAHNRPRRSAGRTSSGRSEAGGALAPARTLTCSRSRTRSPACCQGPSSIRWSTSHSAPMSRSSTSRTSTCRRSCCRSIRPRAPRMTSRGRCSLRSTRWRRTSDRTQRLLGRCRRLDAVPSEHVDKYAVLRAVRAPRSLQRRRRDLLRGQYLNAAGATTNLPAAIYAYNHSDAYVQSVMLRAELLAGVPSTSLTP